MNDAEFVAETGDGEIEFSTAGAAARYLLDHGFADPDREPHWHLRWCLDRMALEEDMNVGSARVARCRPTA